MRRLHLRNCYISTGLTTPGQLSIPSHVLYDLTHLQITSPFPASVWGLLLHPHLLPSLVSLSVKSPAALDDQPLGSPDTFEFALSAVAPQLIEFATLGHSHLAKLLTKSLLWQHFSALRHLTLASARPHQALLQLPTRIASLRVDFQPRSPDGFTVEMSQIGIQIFNEEVEGVRELEEICFPGWESLTVNGTISRRVHVEAWVKFEQEGVRVVHLPNNAPFVVSVASRTRLVHRSLTICRRSHTVKDLSRRRAFPPLIAVEASRFGVNENCLFPSFVPFWFALLKRVSLQVGS